MEDRFALERIESRTATAKLISKQRKDFAQALDNYYWAVHRYVVEDDNLPSHSDVIELAARFRASFAALSDDLSRALIQAGFSDEEAL